MSKDRHRYLYSVVRYLPNVVRGEFVNVGVLAGSDTRREFDLVSVIPTAARVSQIGGSLRCLTQFLQPLQDMVDEYASAQVSGFVSLPRLSEDRMVKMSSDQRSAIQITRPLPLLAGSVEQAIEIVKAMAFPTVDRRRPEVTKYDIKNLLKQSLAKEHIVRHKNFAESVKMKSSGNSETVDFVISNGEPRMLIQGFSFFSQDSERVLDEVRSWAFFIERLRDEGATMQAIDGTEMKVKKEVPVVALCAAPENPTAAVRDLQEQSASAFKAVRATQRRHKDAGVVATEAKAMLGH